MTQTETECTFFVFGWSIWGTVSKWSFGSLQTGDIRQYIYILNTEYISKPANLLLHYQ